eukprot:m.103458 g.103458  ORF g.103458 m.103458 type:complete len:50 (-) comp27500_c0_seq1:23-172(-)
MGHNPLSATCGVSVVVVSVFDVVVAVSTFANAPIINRKSCNMMVWGESS